MYIAPSSSVKLLHNVPLDPGYRNSLYFKTAAAQESYFSGRTKYSVDNYSYQRTDKTLNIELPVGSNPYNCTYMMFRNAAFENKWFYAFILNVEYVNNVTFKITFELDVLQTWFFDAALHESFVEREHSVSDAIGDNLVPEYLESGDAIIASQTDSGHMELDTYYVVFAATFNILFENAGGEIETGIFSGLHYMAFKVSDISLIKAFISDATTKNKRNGIVSCFMMPGDFYVQHDADYKRYTLTFSKTFTDIDGYTPRNKKLFTYPYNYLNVTNMEGMAANYKYELFNTTDINFLMSGSVSCNPQVIVEPQGYKIQEVSRNSAERLTLGSFPQCSWSSDAFQAYLAQNAASLPVSMISTTVSATYGAMIAKTPTEAIAARASGVAGIAQTLAGLYDKATQPPQASGSNNGESNVTFNLKDFFFRRMTIRAEFAKIIDDYFNMYGYATHRVKIPNRSSRPHWNFVKTQGCNIVGNLPAEDMAKLRGIYDNGITFWRNAAEFGNYNLDNSPT